MKKEEREQLLDHLSESKLGDAIKEYIDVQINDLNSVREVKEVEEVIGRQLAIEKLERIKRRLLKIESEQNEGSQYR